MLDVIWLNLVEMSKIDEFSVLLEKVIDAEKDWKTWCDTEAPEEVTDSRAENSKLHSSFFLFFGVSI